jgi:hypothetical protein
MPEQNEIDDAAVVNAFVSYLAKDRYPGIQVDARPDLDNRRSSDIDAVAGRLAIEHTSIDTIENQRRNSAWFAKIALPLEDRFRSKLAVSTSPDLSVRGCHSRTGLEGHAGCFRRVDIFDGSVT